ncbi:casein kinase II subunit alpha, chloroplastic-like [Gossypium australe]|uniref:Casein kinase II subunit alpha, chloroplastic-like n=1 Tax=Gossypium australe TaxID=47621 RepID=A0A5B6VY46_9ROSI|nr:casein kinase II subunit alpha, chloroplastic-like [Gossypium australe]
MFCNGLDAHVRSGLGGATRGALMNRTYDDAYELIKNIAMNSYQWQAERYTYGQKPSTIPTNSGQTQPYKSLINALSIYGGYKPLSHYINNPTEDVKYIRNRGGNPYSNTYNLRWRDHSEPKMGRKPWRR